MEKYDIEKIKELLNSRKWTWAKTYLSVPHEYIVRGKCGLSDDDFLYIVHAQRALGVHERWGKYNFPYLYIDGYKYWTMGNSFDLTKIINRQKVFSEFDSINPLVQFRNQDDVSYISNEIRKRFNKPIFDVGFGDGWLINNLGLNPKQWYGIEPSEKCINSLRQKYCGFYRRVSKQSFEQSIDKWQNSEFFVVALFGSASYLMKQYLKLLCDSNNDYFLMFYKENKQPEPFINMHHFNYSRLDIVNIFNKNVYEYNNYYIVTNIESKKEVKKEYIQTKLF